METPTIENQLHLDNAELIRRNALLEETLKEKEGMLESLKGSEKQYRRLFESAKDGILIIDADTGQVDDVNPFLLALIGCTYDMVYGTYLWELGVFKDVAESKEAFKTLQDNQYIRYEKLPLLTLDGRHIEVEFICNVYLVDNKKVIQCNIRDITARKQAERIMMENESKMRSILDNIGIGVALISPEMVILELNRRMRNWFPDVDIGQEHLCYQAFNDPPDLEACTNCPAVKTFLDGAVHENTRQVLQNGVRRDYRTVSSPVRNASGKVMAVIEMVEDIDLVWPPEAGLKPIMMDPAQLDQSMANLCVNARDAISGIGKITVKTAMVSFDKAYCDDHEGFNPGDFILLTVSDNGCGMEKKIQKNIFEPFFTTTGNSRDYSPEVIN